MNQVWVFFKLIEVLLGSVCMFFHIRGSTFWPERTPHVILYCATFLSFAVLAALGAFRLMLTRSSVLSSQLLLTLSAVIAHYICGVLIMRTALQDPHLPAINSSIEYLTHPHFAHCKQQSIAALITGTMYLMHMFHVFDLLMRMEPGDWRRQATGGKLSDSLEAEAGRAAGLFVLSKPVDDFLCSCCQCYLKLAYSQPLRFRLNAEAEQPHFVARMWQVLGEARRKFFSLHHVGSDESFLSTPTITSSDSDIVPVVDEYLVSMEEQAGKRHRSASTWRGTSDSSSLWAQIEDRSSLSPPSARPSQSSEATMRPSGMDRRLNRRANAWTDSEPREKSEILLVEQGSSYSRSRTLSNAETLHKPRHDGPVRETDKEPHRESTKSTRDERQIRDTGEKLRNMSTKSEEDREQNFEDARDETKRNAEI
ncbi:uncharacterized protein LOC128253151 [Drosophila gunungcola]|uniref:DUF7775 domain-containing protein n=1 Tax=Drosophila gunungcola TaxID=103775 RepID=A0A9P9YKJ7_9MUSC|nr:uncharacterized protein LOC128253151 [Drosophila gunungcola]XP_052837319.1 uncharacterized protein LOC128253151 [Drosophila gunungcola]KAI8038234.1 hypothetical protein M5D96_008923 [Drosophila gunungcola]